MAYRMLEVTLQSARNLKNVNLMSRLEVYAVATISGDPMTRQCTPPDPYGGRHPTWNTTLRFTVPPTAAAGASGCLHVLLRTERSLGDRDVGEVVVPLTDILGLGGSFRDPRDLGPRPPQFAVYHVRRVHRPADTYGVLYLSYRLGGVVLPQPPHPHPHAPHPHHVHAAAAHEEEHHVVAYPVAARPSFHHHQPYAYMPAPALMPPPPQHSAQASSGSGGHMSSSPPSPRAYGGGGHMALAPPLSKAYGYGHLSMPPLQASGHTAAPLQASGHMATPPAPQKAAAGYAAGSTWTRNNGSADLGIGGGMMAGDMMSDAAAYNAGYRAGMAREWSGVRGAVY
ncbi:hypothetical protein CFC21_021872 [Triticum aestivum]|uniref:C2 domain-containing protein n=3 Tax=Triticum TaxID=4564 RepID=A0A9R1RIE7_TRITD|nr:protein SRC2-like [Triticum aestivum]KAF7006872.1 hypothetical protein CFC21_021872 [Triticum aestivum]VAH42465.1 unnamed protein product [Triticum turgidum subsp. durum]